MSEIVAPFEITGWDEDPYLRPDVGPKLSRVTVRKHFTGPLHGDSVAELLTVQGDRGQSYVGSERVEASLEGRSGTFVIQHGAAMGPGESRSFGHVVPGSGTGDLAGLRGDASFEHDDAGARLLLSYEL
jgi:hypothetical protein